MLPLIIRLLMSALNSNDIRILIIGLLKNYSKNEALKVVLDKENVSTDELNQPYAIFNPTIIKKFLSILKPAELAELKNQLNKMGNISKTFKNAVIPNEYKYIKNKINKVSNLFNEQDNKEEKQNNQDEKGWVILSSSWFKKGNFYLSNKTTKTGVLLGLFQSDNSKSKKWYGAYTYPSFPQEIWELMKIQKGKNGTGAGQVFWDYFLKGFLPSAIRKYVKSQLKQEKGITKGRKNYYILKHNNINVLKTTAFINKLERGFFNKKEFKNLKSTELASKAWKVERRSIFEHGKNKNIGYSIYKSNNKTYKKLGKW